MKKPLIIIAGPTASGKTKLAVELAKAIGGEIISADSMQVYKGMDIGSAKVTEDEKQGVKHYLIDVLQPDEPFNVHVFQTLAKKAMDTIYKKGKIPMLVGGTGFYIQSILYDIDFNDQASENKAYREELEKAVKTFGREALHQRLRDIDPGSYQDIHPNNVKKVIRALEYYHETGQALSEHNRQQKQKKPAYNALFYVLNMDRDRLYKRINKRVDGMMEAGLVEEVKHLLAKGYKQNMVSMQGLGYKEVMAALAGDTSMDEASRLIKRDTRRFAKRQLTWFRREASVKWVQVDQYNQDQILKQMVKDVEVLTDL